jgi:hypothetical protein
MLRDQPVPRLLEHPPPGGIYGVGSGEVLVEEVPDIAEIDSVDAFRRHEQVPEYTLAPAVTVTSYAT